MQKKILMVTMTAGMAFMLFACGSDAGTETTVQSTAQETTVVSVVTKQEVTTVAETTKKEKVTKETTTVQETTTQVPTTKKVEETTKKAKKPETTTKKAKKPEKTTKSNASGKEAAKKYVGKSLDSLVAAVGKYKTSEKAPSCLYEGENDGIFYWKDFTVSAHTKKGKWIVDSVD